MTIASTRRSPQGGLKVVVTGPFAAGKTTLIATVSEIDVLSTEKRVTDETRVHKPDTTVAMDFGRLTTADGLVLHLFGTPGQERFDFMREILAEGMLGYVLVVDATRPESWPEARAILAAFRAASPAPVVIAANRASSLGADLDSALRRGVGSGPRAALMAVDARDPESVRSVLVRLVDELVRTLSRADEAVTA